VVVVVFLWLLVVVVVGDVGGARASDKRGARLHRRALPAVQPFAPSTVDGHHSKKRETKVGNRGHIRIFQWSPTMIPGQEGFF
jgi:hypothetical protein